MTGITADQLPGIVSAIILAYKEGKNGEAYHPGYTPHEAVAFEIGQRETKKPRASNIKWIGDGIRWQHECPRWELFEHDGWRSFAWHIDICPGCGFERPDLAR